MEKTSVSQRKDALICKAPILLILFLMFGFFFFTSITQARGIPQVMFIFDASGSMWGDVGGQTKIEAAKEVMTRIVPNLPSEVKTGLTVYGHKRKGDCSDIEVLVSPGSTDRGRLLTQLKDVSPKGKTPIKMRAIAVNIADSLKDIPAGAVIITKEGNEKFKLTTSYTGNSYYFYKTKPLPAGLYRFAVHYKKIYRYKTSNTPVVLAKNIRGEEQKESVVTIDSGIQLKKVKSTPISAWELIPINQEKFLIKIERATNGDYSLWQPYALPPGTYDLAVFPEGMTEALPVGEGITIKKENS